MDVSICTLRVALQRKGRRRICIRIRRPGSCLAIQTPVFLKGLLRVLCGQCCKVFAKREASQAEQRCAAGLITFSSAAHEHVAAYLEQTALKTSSFLILKDKLIFSRLQGCNSWCSRHTCGNHLPAEFPFVLAVASPGTTQAWGIAGFEHSCHVGLLSEGFDVPVMMMLNIYATQNSGV